MFIAKATPLQLVDIFNPGLSLSLEVVERKSGLGTQVSFAYLKRNQLDLQTRTENLKGFRFSFEQKKYFETPAPKGVYLSLGVDYVRTKFIRTVDYNNPEIFGFGWVRAYNVPINKTVMGITGKVGFQREFKHIVYELFWGFGLRHRKVIHEIPDTDNLKVYSVDDRFINRLTNGYFFPGKSIGFAMPMNFRIGYAF